MPHAIPASPGTRSVVFAGGLAPLSDGAVEPASGRRRADAIDRASTTSRLAIVAPIDPPTIILLNSTYLRTPSYDFEYLVVELKRSSVKLGSKELTQVESDALTVSNDDRFDKQRTKWTWYLIGVECDEFVEEKRMSQDRPAGLVVNRPGVQVWVKTWAEVVSAAKRRYEFFLKALETELTGDDGLADLTERHRPYLPPQFG